MTPASIFIKEISEELPEGWDGRRLKYISRLNFSNVNKKSEDGEKEVFLCNYVDVYYNDFITSKLAFMKATASEEEIKKFLLHKGMVLLTKDSETADDIGIPAYVLEEIDNLVCGYHLAILRPNNEFDGKFLFRFFQSRLMASYFEQRANGITRYAIGLDTVGNSPILFPPLPIQKAIAVYLDKETARIDALIAKKERQIELLQEKRQAIITRAITKGLDPIAKMKDSGVEWIGEIPEGWEEIKGRFLFTFIGGGTPSTEEVTFWEGDIPWVSSKDMKKLFLEDTEDHINSIAVKNSSTNILPSNTLLLVMRSGILQHTIPVAIICKDMAVNQDIKGFLPKQTLNPIYFAYFIQGFQAQLLTEWRKEGATVESLDLDSIKNFTFPLPSLVEQNNIVKTIAIQLDAITNLGNSVLESISLLREYRSSLITAAVSGQIDVSHEVAL